MQTIHEAAAAIRQGKLTPIDLLNRCLERIDHLEERVRAWVLVDRDARTSRGRRLRRRAGSGP